MSVDLIVIDANTGKGFGLYTYVDNNPYSKIDPDGRQVAQAIQVCARVPACAAAGAAIAGATGKAISNAIQNSSSSSGSGSSGGNGQAAAPPAPAAGAPASGGNDGGGKTAPPLPDGLVGTQDGDSRQQGNRQNNGPLAPSNGGTGNAQEDFGKLTGGTGKPAPEGSRLPAGSQVGDNGVIIRPGTGQNGPRIDIPANGDKPHETLHYPKE